MRKTISQVMELPRSEIANDNSTALGPVDCAGLALVRVL